MSDLGDAGGPRRRRQGMGHSNGGAAGAARPCEPAPTAAGDVAPSDRLLDEAVAALVPPEPALPMPVGRLLVIDPRGRERHFDVLA